MRINHDIRAPKVRLIGADGNQVGIVSIGEARRLAQEASLDLVEVVPNASPPVCKIIDYGKFRYDQTKREKESKKAQHKIKIKEVKVKPNISQHDFDFKLRHVKEFLEKGYKVKLTCTFRGRELAHTDVGKRVVQRMLDEVKEEAMAESTLKMMGRSLSVVVAPLVKSKRKAR